MPHHPKPWYENVFSRIGHSYLTNEYTKGTKQEVDFIEELLRQHRNALILDLGCGPGRHALELTRRGYCVVGLDLSHRFLQIAQEMAGSMTQRPSLVCGDARQMPFGPWFDWAICLCEGAFGIMPTNAENQQILHQITLALKPGGLLFLNVLHAGFSYRHPQVDEKFDPKTCTGYWTEYYTAEDGIFYQDACSNRYYSYPEIELRLSLAGLRVIETWGGRAGQFARKPIELDDFELFILAQKAPV